MKKRAKPKPKQRVPQKAPAPKVVRKDAVAAVKLAPAPVETTALARSNRARLAGPAISADDRSAIGLLLLPFLIVAAALSIVQTRRASLPSLPAIAMIAPVPATAPSPAPRPLPEPPVAVAPFAPPPDSIVVPGPVPAFPPPLPVIEPRVATPIVPVPPTPNQVAIPGPVRAFPPPLPVIEPRVAAPIVPVPPTPNQVAVPGPVPAFPPPLPVIELPAIAQPAAPPAVEITVAALDARPPVLPPTPLAGASEAMCSATPEKLATFSAAGRLARAPRRPRVAGLEPEAFGRRLAAAAVAQTEDLVIYTARYQPMAYPLGDVMAMHGACIDVIIRAYRELGIDLQEDVQRARSSRGDPNIDHRRTENMRRFLERHGASLPITSFPEDYKPGDIVTYYRPFSRVSTSHIAIVTDVLAPTGRPMIVHNRGYGPQLEDALFVDRITGHYRYMGPAAPATQARDTSAPASKQAPVVRASFPR